MFRRSKRYDNVVTEQLAYFIYSKLSSGAIAGIVVAVVAAVLSAGAAFFFYRRWKAVIALQYDPSRVYTSQQQPLDSVTVAPTGFSSSLETRSNATLLRNDTSTQAFSGAQQPVNNHAVQQGVIASGSRDSRSIIDTVSSPTQSAADEVRPFRLVHYSKDVECVYTHRVWGGGLFQKRPEEVCHCLTNFQNLRIRDVVKVS